YVEEELPKKRNGDMHRVCLPWWKDRVGSLRLTDVTPAVIVEHRGKLTRESYTRSNSKARRSSLKEGEQPKCYQRSNSTVNRYLACLSHVFTVARKEWHWTAHNPFDGVAAMRENKGRTRYLSDDERIALLAETVKAPTLHCLVVVALSTAARAGELLNLTW